MKEEVKNIPVVILAGGNGTRVGTGNLIPKPMAEINHIPLIQYIMDYFSGFGFRKFVIAMGNYSESISSYFNADYKAQYAEKYGWEIENLPTGINDNTGSRIYQLSHLLKKYPFFILTYGDVIADVNLNELIEFHLAHGKMATVTAVHYPTRFRILGLYGSNDEVRGFADKPVLQKDFINGGFYILNNEVLQMKSLTQDPACSFERHVLEELVSMRELIAYRHEGYWQSLDTERDLEGIKQFLLKK